GGNIGNPLINFAAGAQEEDWAVVEMSSFQLEGIEQFRPRVSVLLNITEDHLDRYASFADYGRAKERIFLNQGKEDFAVLNADDPLTFRLAERLTPRVVLFSSGRAVPWGCRLEKRAIVFRGAEGKEERFDLAKIKIRGAHNLENFMAAVAASRTCGASPEDVQKVIDTFEGIEHRLEFVRDVGGVKFFNDSKGTNVGSVVKSLQGFDEPVWLIAGGRDKEGSYSPLNELVAEKVKGMALIGEAKDRIFAALGGLTEAVKVGTLEEAVRWCFSKAKRGDVVLLSPACASYDMFLNYQDRGRQFKEIVGKLKAQHLN
ncbi:MAG TPA: UDP-N-acetylmuramoyl-L-alanine--D-glutamate ligase, partial [Thermodesulfobacteriota bacterium]|nr:UDP-N-acetylmuramoyl-L-alanine--D-glutamate ligase [Thermodesulfobacteriota bacterium]